MEENVIYKSKQKTIYLDGDKIIKAHDDLYDTSLVLNEALNQSKVYEAGISVPKVYEVKRYNNKLGIVMDYIDGENLENLIMNNPNDINKYMDIFVSTYHDFTSNKALNLNNSYGRIKNKIFSSELPANIKYGLFYKLREMEFARDVIHGDYIISNIIIDRQGKAVVLDWGHVAFGDRKLDMAITYALFELKGQEKLGELYLDKICELENIKKEQVFSELILAYIYIVDRYDEDIKNKIYNKIYEIIKSEEE